MAYAGRERRVHRVFVTLNTEYHVRRQTCVGVRDRRTGRWLRDHTALRGRVSGGLSFLPNGSVRACDGEPGPGESLFVVSAGRDLVTSPLVAVDRPARDVVERYVV
ncbi:MAG: hypothetical protein KC543_11950 [Myxococcales bacterium]|nr:hypothetical protein [Myxococcales bacterium]